MTDQQNMLPALPPLPVHVEPQSVEAATHDIINNGGCASQIEWLQRTYSKLSLIHI